MGVQETDEKWLWLDPFDGETDLTSGAVLLAEGIKRYVERNVLVNREHFEAGKDVGAKLKGAGYTMTPDPDGAWTFEGEEDAKKQVVLYPIEDPTDPKGLFYLVEQHSLVYIRLRQQLRIPYYFIGRHNLKITYVYQGLLLGTGPQVDPGYVGHLIIPLHNLTTRDVRVYVKESFVSVDFVRTTKMKFDQGDPKTRDELYEKYAKAKELLDLKKVDKRRELRDYLEGKTPQSAMHGVLEQYRELSTKYEATAKDLSNSQSKVEADVTAVRDKISDDLKSFRRIEWLAVIVVMLTFFGAVYGVVWGVRDYHRDIGKRQDDLQAEITKQTKAVQDVRAQVGQLCKQLASAKGVKLVVGPCP